MNASAPAWFNSSDTRPLFRQLAELLRKRLPEFEAGGGQLPSNTALIAEYEVPRQTVQQALRLLMQEGLVVGRHGVGVFLAAHVPAGKSGGKRGAPSELKAEFSLVLRGWVDSEVAMFALGRALGVLPAVCGLEGFWRARPVLRGATGETLLALLAEMQRGGLVESQDGRWRWCDGKVPCLVSAAD